MELDIRGTEADTIREYLAGMGGVQLTPDHITGEGWEARLTLGVHRLYRWEFPRVVVAFSGEPEAVAAVAGRLRLLAFRGGG
ncbi:MAG TPA: hypothetical protein VD902_07210 [Symbiobacteriaceae bacterium]|nr:hypothetical protein [Symbiobacteriaceae bacterium]